MDVTVFRDGFSSFIEEKLITLRAKWNEMMKGDKEVAFDRNTVEFVTVAAEYCAFLERSEGMKRAGFVDTMLKILPLLYIKAQMLPPVEQGEDIDLENFVSEDEYEVVRLTVAAVMAGKDDYLEVFMQDMQYSDTPITATISEGLADIYQDIKDFVSLYKLGFEQTMSEAVARCKENFEMYWGQKLVNTLRALHEVRYGMHDEEDENADDLSGDETDGVIC